MYLSSIIWLCHKHKEGLADVFPSSSEWVFTFSHKTHLTYTSPLYVTILHTPQLESVFV